MVYIGVCLWEHVCVDLFLSASYTKLVSGIFTYGFHVIFFFLYFLETKKSITFNVNKSINF